MGDCVLDTAGNFFLLKHINVYRQPKGLYSSQQQGYELWAATKYNKNVHIQLVDTVIC